MIGGGEYAIYKYAEALAVRGYEVTVVGQFQRPYVSELKSLPNLNIIIRGGIEKGIKGAGLLNRWWDTFHTHYLLLPRLRQEWRPDIIIGYQRRSSIKAAYLGRKLDVPVGHIAFEPPTAMIEALGSSYEQIMQGAVGHEWEEVKRAYQSSACLMPLSEDAGRKVAAWCGREVEGAVYAGMEAPDWIMQEPAKEEFVLYVGRLDSTKNVHDLIDAMALLRNPTLLVIAGNGYDRPELEARARSKGIRCEFKGSISDQEKWRLIRSCYFLVFPTSLEGLGMPPGEALAAEKPAICSDIPVLREVYGDAVEYFPLHDLKALAAKMEELLGHPDCRRQRGVAGRAFVLGRYLWDKCSGRIEEGLRTSGFRL